MNVKVLTANSKKSSPFQQMTKIGEMLRDLWNKLLLKRENRLLDKASPLWICKSRTIEFKNN